MLFIKALREENNLTQDEMVAKTGIPKRSYVDYENEKADIKLSNLQKIASVLKVSVSELIGETKSEKNVTVSNGNKNSNIFGNKPNVQKMLPNEDSEGAGVIKGNGQEIESLAKKIKFSEGVRLTDFGAPFYPLPVSAGTVAELVDMEERPTGYISIPGVSVKAYFPVVGCSFEPLIRAGDIIGIDFIDKWEILDPDCIYYILTHDQRLIKRLMRHPEDKGKLVCISPNYKEFTLETAEIKRIFKVVFYGRLV